MTDILIPRQELEFLLFDWLGVGDRDTVGSMLELAERVATDLFLPHYRESDMIEPQLDGDGVHVLPAIGIALREYAALGLFAVSLPEALGGLRQPQAVGSAVYAQFAAANIATAAYPMLTVANARLIAAFGNTAQVDAFARPQVEGRWFGTMCLSEPQAGSSLADVRTRAEADGEDEFGVRYRLTGNKMWISGGDQDISENIVHLVLAKAQLADGTLPEGSKGVSLFIVPKILPDGARNDVVVAGLNHKMGYRGTANCLLNLGEGAGAIGWRVGAEGQGLAQMFMMMNDARISVGIGAAALGYRGYRRSAHYARARTQGRLVGQRGGSPVAIIEHPDVRRMLLQQKSYVEGALALCLFCSNLINEATLDAEILLGLLTPVAKSWPSEFCLAANDIAIQIHGGYGYTRDFDVEQLYRDNRLNPIHEGTTGIQAIDLLGRKILRADGLGMTVARRRIEDTAGRAESIANLSLHAAKLRAVWDQIDRVVADLTKIEGAAAYDEATLFLRAFGHAVVAWLWLDQAIAAFTSTDGALREGKFRACRFFYAFELPQASTWLDVVAAGNDVAASAPYEIFA